MMELGFETTILAVEAQQVMTLRMAALLTGGPSAALEAQLMITEKVLAAGGATATIASGGRPRTVVTAYRKKVRANKRRLSR